MREGKLLHSQRQSLTDETAIDPPTLSQAVEEAIRRLARLIGRQIAELQTRHMDDPTSTGVEQSTDDMRPRSGAGNGRII